MSAISLPRSMVLRLLHLAQQGAGTGLITRLADGELKIHPLRPGSAPPDPDGETLFAFYRTSAQTQPETQDIEAWQSVTPLFLSVSVGIKGVLQLRGWRAAEGKADQVELSLAEEDTAQNSGVSRKA
ncbi:MAG: hypothetical protein ACHQAU_05335 [Gammaproteobacteria bacterium]